MSVNKWIGIGNLGRDAELKYTSNGTAVAHFSIACNETWKDKEGNKQERVEWVRVNLWGKQAEGVHEYLKKGKQVYVEGRMETREWEKEGQKHYTTEIRADRLVLLGGQGGGRRQDEDESERGPVGGDDDRF